jgi:hypothetical protein
MYLGGRVDGLGAGYAGDQATYHVFVPSSPFTIGEMQSALTTFCTTPENANVPVLYGMGVVTGRVSGLSPEEVEKLAATARRASVGQPQPSSKSVGP